MVQGGYYPTRGFDLDFVAMEKKEIDGYQGVVITLHNPTDQDTGTARFGNANVFVDCIDPNVNDFYQCQEVSHYTNTKDWPVLECRTIDGKQFYINENEEMAKISGIDLYTTNYLSTQSIEFVGKTDRTDLEITFSIDAPNGDEVSTWKEFAPAKGEFRTTVTTGDPLWKQQDGIYTITVKQTDMQYYVASSEFQIKDGNIVR